MIYEFQYLLNNYMHSQDFNQNRIFLHDLFPWGLCSWPKCVPTVLPTSLPTVLRLFVEIAPSANGNEKRSGSVSVSEESPALQDSTSDAVRTIIIISKDHYHFKRSLSVQKINISSKCHYQLKKFDQFKRSLSVQKIINSNKKQERVWSRRADINSIAIITLIVW